MADEDAGKLVGERKKFSMVKLSFLIVVGLLIVSAGILGGLYWKFLYLPAPTDVDLKTTQTVELLSGNSIAVLPFVNMTGDPDEDSFCDGFTEMLISTLSYSPDLLVIARNSSFAYKGKQINIQEIGKELNAEYIIEGSVQKSKERIRIIVQLINAVSGHHEWSKTYDKEFKDIFQLQDEIVPEIFLAIGEELVWGGTIKNVFQGVKSNEELKMLTEAVTFWEMESPESSHRAQEISLELIEMNPTIPMAYTVLSSTYLQDIYYDKCASTTICGAKAMAALKKALSLNEDSDWAHIVSGQLYLGLDEHDKAVDYFKTAISHNPNNAYAYNWLGNALIYSGQPDQAIVHINKAISLNPKQSYTLFFALGFAHQDMRDFENAIVLYNKSLSLNPDYWSSYIGLAIVYGHMGDREKAKIAIDNLFRIYPDFSVNNFLKTMSYKYEKSRNFLREGIQKAGLKVEE
jgi:adenylate cyclase